MKTRPILVVLHGANGSEREMDPLTEILRAFDVRVPNLLGHGGRPPPDLFDFNAMVEDLAAWQDAAGIGPCHFLGYSFGGYVALALARRNPGRVRSLVAIALRHSWDEATVRHVVHLTDPDRLARPGNPRAAQMAAAHGFGSWRKVTLNNRAMFASFGDVGAPLLDGDFARIEAPVLILSGEDDPLVPADEARALARLLPNARVGLWPGPAHPLSSVPLIEVKYAVGTFIEEVEGGRFVAGQELHLTRQLVDGGVQSAGANVRVRRRKARP